MTRTSPRIHIREAFRRALRRFNVNAGDMATRAGTPPATLSEFRNGKREVTTATLQSFLDAMEPEVYQYFLQMLTDGFQMVQGAEPQELRSPSAAEANVDTLLAIVATYCSNCSSDEQLELLRVIYDASLLNPRITERNG